MHCFRTAELYFRSLIDCFDILATSEHCLFEEQLGTLTSKCNINYNCIAVSPDKNTSILSRKAKHGGVVCCGKSHLTIMLVPQKTTIRAVLWEFNASNLCRLKLLCCMNLMKISNDFSFYAMILL